MHGREISFSFVPFFKIIWCHLLWDRIIFQPPQRLYIGVCRGQCVSPFVSLLWVSWRWNVTQRNAVVTRRLSSSAGTQTFGRLSSVWHHASIHPVFQQKWNKYVRQQTSWKKKVVAETQTRIDELVAELLWSYMFFWVAGQVTSKTCCVLLQFFWI